MGFTILVEGFMNIKLMHFSYVPLLWIERRICSKLKFTIYPYWPCPRAWIPDPGIMNFDVLVEGFLDIKIMQYFMHLYYMSIWSHLRVWIPDPGATNFTIIIMHFLFFKLRESKTLVFLVNVLLVFCIIGPANEAPGV